MLRCALKFAAGIAFQAVLCVSIVAAEPPAENWLRGSGKDLEICFRGEVVDAEGAPASDFELTAEMRSSLDRIPLKPKVDGNRFAVWIPVNRSECNGILLRAVSRDGKRAAFETFGNSRIRQAAIDETKLTLEPFSRRVKVQVTDAGQPVGNAHVKAELAWGACFESTTNSAGVATLDLLDDHDLDYLTAWTDDHRIGGYSFHRTPTRDSNAKEHLVELTKGREERLRFVAEDGSPIPNERFLLFINSAAPHYNFIGTGGIFWTTSDDKGEALYRWYPDWKQSNSYAETDGEKWLHDGNSKMVDGVRVFTYKQRAPRKLVTGKVTCNGIDTSPAGFFVQMRSFKSERPNNGDAFDVFSNTDGTFVAEVLPDAAYAGSVQDERWVCKPVTQTLYESSGDKITPPEFEMVRGQPVEVTVVSGPTKEPVANMSISFRHDYPYTWLENGKQARGIGSSQWWATTNKQGIATTIALPGELEVSIYTPTWRANEKVAVAAVGPTKVTLHREVQEPRIIKGQLTLTPETSGTAIRDVPVSIASLVDQFEDVRTIRSNAKGEFSFETLAPLAAIFARTADGKAAGLAISKKGDAGTLEIPLQPTVDYLGQLLLKDDRPAAGYELVGFVRIEGEKRSGSRGRKLAELLRQDTQTDDEGNFTFTDLPISADITILTVAKPGQLSRLIKEVRLEPGRESARVSSYVERPLVPPTSKPLAERYAATLRDCALGGYRPMIILADDGAEATKFANEHYVDYETNHDVYPFMQLVLLSGKRVVSASDAEFLKDRGWPLPQLGQVVAIALDADGKELGRQEIEIGKADAANSAREFVRKHAPAAHDAEAEWNAAFAEAKQTNRSVWVRVSQRYCGPCLMFSRWLDDQRKPLEKDYVVLKIDDAHDTHGQAVAQRLTRGKHHGIPFHGIFSADGELLVDSAGPLGNVGHPNGDEGKKQLRKMLLQSRRNLTDVEIEKLCESTGE